MILLNVSPCLTDDSIDPSTTEGLSEDNHGSEFSTKQYYIQLCGLGNCVHCVVKSHPNGDNGSGALVAATEMTVNVVPVPGAFLAP